MLLSKNINHMKKIFYFLIALVTTSYILRYIFNPLDLVAQASSGLYPTITMPSYATPLFMLISIGTVVSMIMYIEK
jgi:hypothetical protein